MSYLIFGDAFTFPEGDASTNRVYAYAKGFLENGKDLNVICFKNYYLANPTGETENIKYYNPYGQTSRSRSFIHRRWYAISKYLKAYKLIKGIHRHERIAVVLCYTKLFRTQLFAFIISRLCGSKIILERSEYPLKHYKSKTGEAIFGRLKVALEIKYCDYLFCISDYLIDFYRKRGAREIKLFKVPSTVDSRRFSKSFIRPVDSKYICYSGSLTKLKDGVDILINSFSMIASRFPDISLVLVGKADTSDDEIYFRKLVSDLGLNNRVVFTGKLQRNEIPAYLCNAEILVLARPRSKVADAGFPSKVTEYLATGKPIVATRVGEIPQYLTDNVNAFLSEPDSVDAFAERLDHVLENYQMATKAGINAKELAATIFNYDYQAKRIIAFLESK